MDRHVYTVYSIILRSHSLVLLSVVAASARTTTALNIARPMYSNGSVARLGRPSQPPDLNIIELLLEALIRRMKGKNDSNVADKFAQLE